MKRSASVASFVPTSDAFHSSLTQPVHGEGPLPSEETDAQLDEDPSSNRESGMRWKVVQIPSETASSRGAQAEAPSPGRIHPARRKRAVRARTIDVRSLRPQPSDDAEVLFGPNDGPRPHTRADCAEGPRPCPWVSCRYHLYLDVSPRTGSLKLNFPDLEVWELEESCALDVADRGQAGSERIGALLNLTRERARQLEEAALLRARAKISG